MDKQDMTGGQSFRAGVGAVIQRADGMVLALQRSDDASAWQFPQGGLEQGEEPLDALYREILEETGIEPARLKLLSAAPRLLAYELPPAYRSTRTGRGQALYWYRLLFTGSDQQITLGDKKEFSDWQWMNMADLVSVVAAFRQDVYRQLSES